jgi:hypothetical protein
MRNNGITNPQRQWLNYKPIRDQELRDRYAPTEDEHRHHLDLVSAASERWGFPVGRPLDHWPPKVRAVVRKAVRA